MKIQQLFLKWPLSFIACLLLFQIGFAQEATFSPDKKLTFEISILDKPDAGADIQSFAEGAHLYYRIKRNGKTVMNYSPMGLTLNYTDFFNELTFSSNGAITEGKENYAAVHGKKSKISGHYNQRTYYFTNVDEQRLELQVKVYNEGVAFRYVLPDNYEGERKVLVEYTGFRIDEKGKAWIAPYSGPTKYKPSYELYYTNASKVGALSPESPGWTLPALFNINDGKDWVMLHEAGLEANYPGTHLGNDCLQGVYRIAFPHPGEALGLHATLPTYTGSWEMPWRVIMVTDDLSRIVESNMVFDLNKPSTIDDTSWIRPGRVSWEWWSTQVREREFNLNKKFIDLAASMDWEYCLIDANWNEMKNGTIDQLIAYADEKGIGIFLWYNSGGPHNYVSEQPRGRLYDARVRKEEFARIKSWGVKGIKVDFFNTDKQAIIAQHLDILKDAAEQELMVNFHGCTVPRGWSRTYPNLVSMESVKGEETYGFGPEFPEKAPWYNTILPFTRNVVGPMDYTPVGFTKHNFPRLTTNAHELALTIVFQSALLHFADKPAAYLNQPEGVIDFLKDIPAQFDEVKLLEGYPGEYIAIARRKGNKWYIGVISGKPESLKLELDLSQLGFDKADVTEISDKKEDGFSIQNKKGVSGAGYPIILKPFGGIVLTIDAG